MNGMSTSKYTPSSPICTEPFSTKYAVQEDIGRGKFAVVRRCVCLQTGEIVAAKMIRKRRKGKSCREEILREVVMLELAMAHPRLVSLREVFETQSELILVTEYCSGGELFDECVIKESFKEDDVRKLLCQILEGLAYLHDNNIVHLDLKPQNILLTKPFPEGDIKICDLGFACLTNTGEDIRDIIGTPDYVAPEVLDYEPLNIQTDMWSLGVLTYVMLTACSPFVGDTQQETFCNITQVKMDYPDDLFEHINPLAKDFISKLLIKRPRDRMTARQCLDHPWLADLKDTMVIQVPTPDHSQELAHDMIVPSNWHMSPDRRSSLSSADNTFADIVSVQNNLQTPDTTAGSHSHATNDTNSSVNRTNISEEKDLISNTLSHIDIDRSSCASFETCPEIHSEDVSPCESSKSFTSTSQSHEGVTSMSDFASEVVETVTAKVVGTSVETVTAKVVGTFETNTQPLLVNLSQPSLPTPHACYVPDAARDRLSSDSFQSCSIVESPLTIQGNDRSVTSRSSVKQFAVVTRDNNKGDNSWKRMSTEIPPKRAKCIEEGGDEDMLHALNSSQTLADCSNQESGDPTVDIATSSACNGIQDVRNAV